MYQMGSRWEEKCKTCVCTEQSDSVTGLHIVQCVDPVCNQICPVVSSAAFLHSFTAQCHCASVSSVDEF